MKWTLGRVTENLIERHYAQGGVVEAIAAGLKAKGISLDQVTVDDLAPVDEFHVGGRQASIEFLDQLSIKAGQHVLDLGCGIGGAARLVAQRYGAQVCGIDLTAAFIEAAKTLTDWVDLGTQVKFYHGSALDLPFAEASFERCCMLHVGMNIADKSRLFSQVAQVLRPGGLFGIFDLMQTGDGELAYPVPWASSRSGSSLATPDAYRSLLREKGFEILSERDRRDFAIAFFEEMKSRQDRSGGPPALGTHLVMGPDAIQKVKNVAANIKDGLVSPVELVARHSAARRR